MDSFSLLPLECILLILHYLLHEGDALTLARLLRVNKHIASATLPILYGNPLCESFHMTTHGVGTRWRGSVRHLVRMLLRQGSRLAPGVELPMMVAMALGLEATDMASGSGPATLSLFDYCSHIRHLDVEAIAIIEYNSINTLRPPEMQNFIHKDDFMDKCRRIHVPSAVLANTDVLEKIFLWYLPKVITREVVWTLAYPILERLESLVISVGAIGRYAAVVGRLKRLRRVRFYMDEVFDYNGLEDEYGPEDIRGSGEEDKNMTMQVLVQFVVEHTRLFNGCLKAVQFSSSGEDNAFFEEESVPWETQLAIFQVLPAPYKPTWLRSDNWMQFATKPLSTDLLQVGYINNLTPADLWFDMVRPHRHFLQECRSLKQLHMVSLGPGSFKWAAQEKRDRERLAASNSIRNSHRRSEAPLLLHRPRPLYLDHGLVPLEVVNLSEHQEPHTDELNDIAFAFSQTLKSIDFHSARLGAMGQPRDICFGQGWVSLPRLERLALIAEDDGRIVVERALLTHCPNITYVEIVDQTDEYRCHDIVPCQPADLPSLETLRLRGRSALTFHPATLYSTTSLATLELSIAEHDMAGLTFFIPPIQELNRSYGLTAPVVLVEDAHEAATVEGLLDPTMKIVRPHWSWDWHLPRLSTLRLRSEFAYRFEFKMLLGCPGLKHLALDMLTEERQHPRVITRADLYASSPSTPLNENNGINKGEDSLRRIVAGKLTNLRMSGLWIMDDTILDEFLAGMFPNLRVFSEYGWSGITVRGVVRSIRPRLEGGGFSRLTLSLPQPSEEEMDELGIYPKYSLVDGARRTGLRRMPRFAFTTGWRDNASYYCFTKDMDA